MLTAPLVADSAAMLVSLRAMPNGVRVFLAYALIVLSILSLTLPLIVVEASGDVPISPLGLVWMALLASFISPITLVLQRKQAGWGLSLGLVTFVVPLVPGCSSPRACSAASSLSPWASCCCAACWGRRGAVVLRDLTTPRPTRTAAYEYPVRRRGQPPP